jgi:hypothetical protein
MYSSDNFHVLLFKGCPRDINFLIFTGNLAHRLRKLLGYSRGTCTPMFIAALSTIAKLWKQPRSPTTDECIKKM